jgi:Histidine kinase-like ATPase domain
MTHSSSAACPKTAGARREINCDTTDKRKKLGGSSAKDGGRTVVVELPNLAVAVRLAREAVAVLVDGNDGSSVALVVGELVANAVGHAHSAPLLVACHIGDVVRLEISDSDPTAPVMQRAGPWDTSGRGLHIVDALAEEWGTVFHDGGPLAKTVWAEVALGGAEPCAGSCSEPSLSK